MLKTKIVCTIGPATNSQKMIEKMIKSGMNVARINFSHGTHEDHAKTIEYIKAAREKLSLPVAIMLDTKGPEVRVGKFRDGEVYLENGSTFTLTARDIVGSVDAVSISYKNLPSQLEVGNAVLIDDGNICLEVKELTETDVICKVTEGGLVKNGKGVNFPNVHLDMPHMSEQDKSDILFGIEQDVDFVAASFVRCGEDVINMRKFLDYHGGHAIRIISKIENNEGV